MSTLEVTPRGHVVGPTTHMSRRQLLSAGFGALLAAAGLWLGHGNAAADPHTHDMYLMCTQIASNPTVSGVNDAALSWLGQMGNSHASAQLGAQTLLDAITYTCPEYARLVQQWAATRDTHPATEGGLTA